MLHDGPSPVVLAKSPKAVYEVLVRKEGLYANPPHPFAKIARSYAPLGAQLLGLGPSQHVNLLWTAVDRHFERFPLLEEGLAVGVESSCKRWCGSLLLELLWQVQSPALADFVEEVERLERGSVAFLPSRAKLLRHVLAGSGAQGGNGLDPEDPETQSAVIRTFLNGYNALAIALVWSLVELGRRPDLRQRLQNEPEAIPLTVAEILRLYPPAWVLGRRLMHQDELCGHCLSAGTTVQVSPFVTQRDPQYWSDPERFQPGRPHAARRPSELRYFPFGSGARICPSARWVPHLLNKILARCLERWDFELVGPSRPAPLGWISLHPEPSPKLKIRRR